MNEILLADVARFGILIMFGLTVGQVAWIIRQYARRAKRLLPRHIAVVGVAFLLALFEVAYQNAARVGDPPTLYIPVNAALMGLSLYAMQNMRRHLQSRHDTPCRRVSDLPRRSTDG